jgi:hypothetical protein
MLKGSAKFRVLNEFIFVDIGPTYAKLGYKTIQFMIRCVFIVE